MLIGRLCTGDSFGESTVLKGLPMSCSVVTDTHVQIGTISTFDVYGKVSRMYVCMYVNLYLNTGNHQLSLS